MVPEDKDYYHGGSKRKDPKSKEVLWRLSAPPGAVNPATLPGSPGKMAEYMLVHLIATAMDRTRCGSSPTQVWECTQSACLFEACSVIFQIVTFGGCPPPVMWEVLYGQGTPGNQVLCISGFPGILPLLADAYCA